MGFYGVVKWLGSKLYGLFVLAMVATCVGFVYLGFFAIYAATTGFISILRGDPGTEWTDLVLIIPLLLAGIGILTMTYNAVRDTWKEIHWDKVWDRVKLIVFGDGEAEDQ